MVKEAKSEIWINFRVGQVQSGHLEKDESHETSVRASAFSGSCLHCLETPNELVTTKYMSCTTIGGPPEILEVQLNGTYCRKILSPTGL